MLVQNLVIVSPTCFMSAAFGPWIVPLHSTIASRGCAGSGAEGQSGSMYPAFVQIPLLGQAPPPPGAIGALQLHLPLLGHDMPLLQRTPPVVEQVSHADGVPP